MSEGRVALPSPRVTLAFTGALRCLDAIQKLLQLGQIALHGIKDDIWVGPVIRVGQTNPHRVGITQSRMRLVLSVIQAAPAPRLNDCDSWHSVLSQLSSWDCPTGAVQLELDNA